MRKRRRTSFGRKFKFPIKSWHTFGRRRRFLRAKPRRMSAGGGMPVNQVMRNFFHGTSRVVKMRYATSQLVTLPYPAGNISYALRANSIYDPWAGVGGTVANGYTLASNYWNHYCVLGAKCQVTFYPRPNTADYVFPIQLFIKLADTNTLTPTTFHSEHIEMNGEFKWKMLRANDTDVKRVTCYFSARKFFNVTDVKDNDDLETTFGANPTEEAFFHIGCAVPSSVAAGLDNQRILGTAVARITYIVSLSEPKQAPIPPQ